MAEREGLNFSEILEKALKKELHVGDDKKAESRRASEKRPNGGALVPVI